MIKKATSKLLCLLGFLIVLLGLSNTGTIQADNPSGRAPRCNYDGICDKKESDQCPDCQEEKPVLEIEHQGLQIVGGDYEASHRVYQFKYVDGDYQNTWTSNAHDSSTPATRIGDADNDEKKEILTVINHRKSEGNKVISEYRKIFMYEDGSTGDPSFTSQDIGFSESGGVRELMIADANNDHENELIMVYRNHIEVYKWDGHDFAIVWNSPELRQNTWSADVGDADNDSQNEVVVGRHGNGTAIVYEYLDDGTWGDEGWELGIAE